MKYSRVPALHALTLLLFVTLMGSTAFAVQLNQVDDFEDGGTALWSEGGPSPNPPVNVGGGGPAGAADKYLSNTSTGAGSSGSRQVMFNGAQWTGDYVTAGVGAIRLDMANFGPSSASMRILLRGSNGTVFVSANAAVLPPDGTWQSVVVQLDEVDMTRAGGTGTLSSALANVSEMRILAAASGPAVIGDRIDTTIGFDNIAATANGVSTDGASWSRIKATFDD